MYEALLKRVDGLRDAYERGRAGRAIDDDTWRGVIWPAAIPAVVLDDDGHVDCAQNTQDRAIRAVLEFNERHGGALWMEVWPYRLPSMEDAWVCVSVQGVAMVADLLGESLTDIVEAGLRYHRVRDTREGRGRRPYGSSTFDLRAYEVSGPAYLHKHTHPQVSQPGEGTWVLEVVAQALLNFPPDARRRSLARRFSSSEVPPDAWGQHYRADLLAELPGAVRDLIERDDRSNHPLVRPPPPWNRGFNAPLGVERPPGDPGARSLLEWLDWRAELTPETFLGEWERLVRDYAREGEFVVEPVLDGQQLARLAVAARTDPGVRKQLGVALDQVASWLLVRLAKDGGMARFAVDRRTSGRTRNLLLALLQHHVIDGAITQADADHRTKRLRQYVQEYFKYVDALDAMPGDEKFRRVLRSWRPGTSAPLERLFQHARGFARRAGAGAQGSTANEVGGAPTGDPVEQGAQDGPGRTVESSSPEELMVSKERWQQAMEVVARLPTAQRNAVDRYLSGDEAADLPPELLEELRRGARASGTDG